MKDYKTLVQEKKKILDDLPTLPGAILDRIMDDFMIEYTYNSNAIEGSTLTKHENYIVVTQEENINGKPIKDILDAINHKRAFHFVRQKSEQNSIMSESLIKYIHTHVLDRMPEARGQYRTVDVTIGGGGDVILASPEMIPGRMEKFVDEYRIDRASQAVVETLARMHLDFEQIHPFIDGNGRTGRLLMNFELMKRGYPPIDIKNEQKMVYYDCFRAYEVDQTAYQMENLIGDTLNKAMDKRIELIRQNEKNKDLGNKKGIKR